MFYDVILLNKPNNKLIELEKTFKDIGFNIKIEISTNINEVDFLDVTFNLENNTYWPYKKPNDKLIYIHTNSNHPPQIIKQLPYHIIKTVKKFVY